MDITLRNAQSAIARILVAIGAMVALVSVADAPVSADEGGELRGTRACRVDPAAQTNAYLLGLACPPDDFAVTLGYSPLLRRTAVGWRYLRPAAAGGGCSGPIDDTGPFWDFADACRTHDYGYDLVRLGVGSRPDADRLLYLDMLASCRDRSFGAEFGCRALARWARVTLDIGESLRMDPARLPRPAAADGHRAVLGRRPLGSGYERLLDLGLVAGILGLQVVRIRPKASRRRRRKDMRRTVGTIGLVTLGVVSAAFIDWLFAQTVVVGAGGSLGLRTLLFMAIVLGLPFGGWVGYRASSALFDHIGSRPTTVPASASRPRLLSRLGW